MKITAKKMDKIFGQLVSNKKLFTPSKEICKNGKPRYYERTTELGTRIQVNNPQKDGAKKLIEHHNGARTIVYKDGALLRDIVKELEVFDVFIDGKWVYDLKFIKKYLDTIKK